MAGACLGRDDANLETLTAPLPDEEGADREERQPWDHGPLLPVRVVLRDLAARGLPAPDETATAEHLWAFLENELKTAGVVPLLWRELHRRGGLLLLDGLDEVPEAEARRTQIRQLVEDLAATLPQARILVTIRTYAYQKQAWRLSGFDEAVLAPFTSGQIRRCVDGWYAHVAGVRGIHAEDAQGRAELLKAAIFASERLRGLAERPLLLTLMASLHAWRGGSLPEKREELYADAVDLLLDWWESQRVVRDAEGNAKLMQPSLAEWLKVDREKVRDLLNRLAYAAHAAQMDLVGTADVPEKPLVDGLLRLSRNPDVRPRRLVEYLSHRAGLLVPRGVGVYTFPHRTFQEYLAACHLADLERLDTLTRLAREDPNRWREVVLLAAAKSERGFTSSVWLFVDSLCGEAYEEAGESPSALWGAHLAAQAVVETADLESLNEARQRKVTRLQQWLVHILRGDRLPAVERVTAAANLAYLGDPRPEVLDVDAMHFCFVPRGPFWMGSDAVPQVEDEFLQSLFDSEKPCHEVDVAYDYWLGRYPVTNEQFATFVEDGGYRNSDYWPEAAAEGLWREEGKVLAHTWVPEKVEQMWRARPHDYGRPFNLPNHPVVGVTWYEALAFTRWLTDRWRAAGVLPAGWAVRLPSEAEWEKGARGGVELPAEPLIATMAGRPDTADVARRSNPHPRRRFPWGDQAGDLQERANCHETGAGSSSGAGCFPAGRSPYDCEEMAGSVDEWCQTRWRDEEGHDYSRPYRPDDGREKLEGGPNVWRVIRGGTWSDDEAWLRCAARSGRYPGGRGWLLGFRVVVSPVPSDL